MSGNSLNVNNHRPEPQLPARASSFHVARREGTGEIRQRESQPLNTDFRATGVSQQLTQLLNRVSKRSTVGVNLLDVHNLAKGRGGTKAELVRDVATYAKGVERELRQLSTLKGTQIAEAFNAKTGCWTGKVGEQITKVQTIVAALSEKLLNLVNNPDIAADPELHALIEEKYLTNCCRESELVTVLMTVADLKGTGKQPLTDEAKEKLSHSLHQWMVELAPHMHGTEDVLNLNANHDLQRLQSLLEGLKGNDGENVSAETRQQLTDATRAVQRFFRQVAEKTTTIDKDFFRSADKVFNKILNALASPRKAALDSLITRHINHCVGLPPALNFSDSFVKALRSEEVNCPTLANYITKRREVAQFAKEYVAARRDPAIPDEQLKLLRSRMVEANNKLDDFLRNDVFAPGKKKGDERVNLLERDATRLMQLAKVRNHEISEKKAGDLPKLPPKFIPELLEKAARGSFTKIVDSALGATSSFVSHLATLRTMMTRFEALDESMVNTKQLLSGIFAKALPVSHLIECRVNGIRDADIDPDLCDANIVSTHAFGEGNANTVYEVKMKDGRTFIFKPEDSGRVGAAILTAAKSAYDMDVNVTALNIAAHDVADFLGVGNLIVDSKVGICNGRLGVFMEKATGVDAADLGLCVNKFGYEAGNDPFKDYDEATFLKVNGQLMKNTYNLEWLDYIIGSGDRHGGNYLVNLSKNGAELKGIDNDMSFGKNRTGFTEITFAKNRVNIFLYECQQHIEKKTGQVWSADEISNKLKTVPGITVDEENNRIKVDLAKLKQPWLRHCVFQSAGTHQLAPPLFIDRGLYDRLIALENDQALRDDYRARLAARMGEENVNAAMDRLTSAIQYAKDLARQNRVINNWEALETQEQIFNIHDAAVKEDLKAVTGFDEARNKLNDSSATRGKTTDNMYFRDFGKLAFRHLAAIINGL